MLCLYCISHSVDLGEMRLILLGTEQGLKVNLRWLKAAVLVEVKINEALNSVKDHLLKRILKIEISFYPTCL